MTEIWPVTPNMLSAGVAAIERQASAHMLEDIDDAARTAYRAMLREDPVVQAMLAHIKEEGLTA